MNPQDSQIHFWVVAVDASIAPKGTLQRVSEADRPGPGEEINDTGVETVPRQAATVIVLRGGSEALELLLVKRNPASRFMGGAWVFPGGAVDAHEGEGDEAHRVCAVRELAEEAGIEGVAPDSLVKYSRWITPSEVKIRFDTHFFLAPLPEGAQPAIDGEEVVDHGWFTPQGALEAHRTGEILLVFPTIKHLEQFGAFPSADALVAHAAAHEVVPVQPRIVLSGETARVLLPGEPGYDAADDGGNAPG
jgi:8-oxo-dGTP pyrophosphatase MutT (NUDIX family)